MKRYLFLVLLSLFVTQKSFSQSLRKCGCQTWREWKKANPSRGESRWSRMNRYEKYKHVCIINCRKREMRGSK